MNYEKIYNSLIEKRQKDVLKKSTKFYTETHHIKPKCLGGNNKKDNLVRLTAREHFIAHSLLAHMYPKGSFNWYKMNNAFLMMKMNTLKYQDRYFNSRLYELLRKNFSVVMSKNQSGESNSQFGKVWVYNITSNEITKIPKDLMEKYLNEGWIKGRPALAENETIEQYLKRKKIITSKENKKIEARKENKKIEDLIFKETQKYFNKLDKQKNVNNFTYNGHYFNTYLVSNLKKLFNFKFNAQTFLNDMDNVKNILYEKYFIKNMSILDLAEEYKVTHPSILHLFKKLDIERRNISDGLKNYFYNKK